MTARKRRGLFWLFRLLGATVSCGLPIWAICERFPLWTETYGKAQSIGFGGVFAAVVLLIVFRRAVFRTLKERIGLKHTPPIAVWIIMLLISYALLFICKVIYDMTVVFWMGLVGCGVGTFLTFIAESRFGEGKERERE